jgi:hypothetical protein
MVVVFRFVAKYTYVNLKVYLDKEKDCSEEYSEKRCRYGTERSGE